MSEIRYEYPLKMPPKWESTPATQRAHGNNFPPYLTLDEAIRLLEDEIHALGIRDVGVITNSQNLNNPRLRKVAAGSNTAATLQFGRSNDVSWLACDKWISLEHNLYALHLALRAIRNLELWGIIPITQLLAALYPTQTSKPTEAPASAASATTSSTTAPKERDLPLWMKVLGLGTTAHYEDAIAVYRRRAKIVANDEKALLELNQAMESAREHFQPESHE